MIVIDCLGDVDVFCVVDGGCSSLNCCSSSALQIERLCQETRLKVRLSNDPGSISISYDIFMI